MTHATDSDASDRMPRACAVISGLLVAAEALIERLAGPPPGDPAALTSWVAQHHLSLAVVDELLFFWAAFLIPVVLLLYRQLNGSSRPWVGFGCGLLSVGIGLQFVLGMILGRLLYPVYGIPVGASGEVAAFTSLYYGGAHELALVLASALVLLGLAMARSTYGRWRGALAVVAGSAQVAASFPWAIGPDLTALAHAPLAAWLILLGTARYPARSASRTARDQSRSRTPSAASSSASDAPRSAGAPSSRGRQ